MIRRRQFITLLGGGAAASWPLAARAQQAGRLPTIGYLGSSTPTGTPYYAAFVQRLHELGWIEGRTVAIEYRWAEGHSERYAEIAAEIVQQGESLRHRLVDETIDAGRVVARPREVVDETQLDRVVADAEDDRDRRGRSFGRLGSSAEGGRCDHVHATTH